MEKRWGARGVAFVRLWYQASTPPLCPDAHAQPLGPNTTRRLSTPLTSTAPLGTAFYRPMLASSCPIRNHMFHAAIDPRRCPCPCPMPLPLPLATPRRPQQPGAPSPGELAIIDTWRLGPDTGRRYGALNGDLNPIHLHPLLSRLFGFKRPIAHALFLTSRAEASLLRAAGRARRGEGGGASRQWLYMQCCVWG